jgi:hypothetical protein
VKDKDDEHQEVLSMLFRLRCCLAAILAFTIAGCSESGMKISEPVSPAKSEAIQNYMKDNFGNPGYETSWYGNITGISVQGDTVVVNTNLAMADSRAQGICSAVSGYVFSNENRNRGMENIQVVGTNGAILIHRQGLAGRCL